MIILMGVAGAGKSVQGKMLAEKLGYEWISTGELLRKSLSGSKRDEMLQGKLLDDEEIIAVVDDFFENNNVTRCVLDGFPRTMQQARWLLKSREDKFEIKAVVHLTAERDVVKKRLLARGRLDDNEAAIDRRFYEYETETLPIVDLFVGSNIQVYEVDGAQSIEQVHAQIIGRLQA